MKRFFMLLFAVVAFAACEQVYVDVANDMSAYDRSLSVSFEGDDTRIQLNEAQKTVWTKGDLVSVFYRSSVNEQWQFEGDTGDRVGNIVPVDNSVNPPATHNRVVVVYPYNAGYFLNTETYSIEASLPAVQSYLKDSYGTDGNIMVSSSNYKQVSLKSVCGWLKLQLTGNGEVVKSITFKGNNGEQVAGELHINTSDATCVLASASGAAGDTEVGGTLVRPGTILYDVTLDCGEGVALGKNATAFYIALPPQTFEHGFTVVIEDTEGYVMEQSTDKALTIERNHIQPMAAFEFINPNRPTQPTPANNEIWYTATEKTDPYFDDFLTFGADVVSNVWDSETKRGIITFDGDVTMIGDDAFNNCDKLTGIILPECVTSIGKNAFYDCDGLTEFTIPDSVTTIGNNAFYDCDSLASVTIGDSVTSIGNYTFAWCDSLTSVNIPDSVTTIGESAFLGCLSLTSVTIPDSVTTIGNYAFLACFSLTKFKGKYATEDGRSLIVDNTIIAYANASGTTYTIPDSVTTIGLQAFSYCASLTSVTIGDSVTTIGDGAFAYCESLTSVTIGDSVTTIGEYAFENCKSLKKVYCYATIPPSLGGSAFSNNASGRRIYVYEECVELYKSAWSSYKDSIYTNGQNCPEITTIEYTTNDGNTITPLELPIISNIYENGVGILVFSGKEIPSSAFRECTNLTSVTIGGSVTSIGYGAFAYCTSLTSVTIGGSVTTIGQYAFYNCYSLTSVNIPDSVTTIGYAAFTYCYSLTSVNIPDSVTEIGEAAFYVCDSLTEFTGKFAEDNGRILVVDGVLTAFAPAGISEYTIPDSVTTIGYAAFSSCYRLTSVTIPDSVTTIRDFAFYECTSLTSVYCKATTPPALGGTSVFGSNGSGRKIYVPAGSVNAYKSATNWSVYASDIVGYNF